MASDTRHPRLRRIALWLSLVTALGMFVVLVMGATVTTTGSAQGCGRDWPLCRGQFVPEFAVATFIEFSHRFVTGIEGILIVALCALVLVVWWDRRPVRVLAPLLLGALLLQAGMGAWAVKYPQVPLVLALHFGFSLVALAAAVLVAAYLWTIDQPLPPPVSGGVFWATWGATAYIYVLVYSGAYIRHTGAAEVCASWPLCPAPPSAAVAVDLLHRGLAALALVVAAGLLLLFRRARRRDLVDGAALLAAALLLQGAAGAYLALSGFGLFAELLHAGLTGVVFVAAAYLCLRVSLRGASRRPETVRPAASTARSVPAR
ncbi:MAG TPA: COX15/CtaA family protein [Candidatus Dormibacteraeota bacterium]